MRYDFNGKMVNIPDQEIEKAMKNLNLTKDEAIEMWLEDEGYIDNPEQLELCQKAKDNKITATIHQASGDRPKKQSKPKTVKVSSEKQDLFTLLEVTLDDYCKEIGGKRTILNPNKLIQVELNGKTFKIDLIEQRKPKKQAKQYKNHSK